MIFLSINKVYLNPRVFHESDFSLGRSPHKKGKRGKSSALFILVNPIFLLANFTFNKVFLSLFQNGFALVTSACASSRAITVPCIYIR